MWAIAHGILGDPVEAHDVVQEAWVRLARTAQRGEPIGSVTGFLVVATSRLAADAFGSARRRRERYVGPWLPEPVVAAALADTVGGDQGATVDPADRMTLAESVHSAVLVVLESLSPAERTAFVLHDVFAMAFDEVAEVLGRSPAAVRQLATRARRHVREHAARFDADPARHAAATAAFAAACAGADLTGLLAVLDPDIELRNDGGGKVRAARNPVCGADRVARFLLGITHRPGRSLLQMLPATVLGRPGLLLVRDDALVATLAPTVADGRITALHIVLNPDKLGRVPWPPVSVRPA